MNLFLKVLSVIGVNIAAYVTLLMVGFLADVFDYVPNVVDMTMAESFYHMLFGFGMMLLMVFALVSLAYLFMTGPRRFGVLFLPLYGTICYSLALLIYFAAA